MNSNNDEYLDEPPEYDYGSLLPVVHTNNDEDNADKTELQLQKFKNPFEAFFINEESKHELQEFIQRRIPDSHILILACNKERVPMAFYKNVIMNMRNLHNTLPPTVSNLGVGNSQLVPFNQQRSWARSNFFVDNFEILRRLGSGATGIVFQARNKMDCREYAVKEINIGLPRLSKKFASRADHVVRIKKLLQSRIAQVLNEIRLISSLNNPNVVRYYTSWVETYMKQISPSINTRSKSKKHSRKRFNDFSEIAQSSPTSSEEYWMNNGRGGGGGAVDSSSALYRLPLNSQLPHSPPPLPPPPPIEQPVKADRCITVNLPRIYIQMELCGDNFRRFLRERKKFLFSGENGAVGYVVSSSFQTSAVAKTTSSSTSKSSSSSSASSASSSSSLQSSSPVADDLSKLINSSNADSSPHGDYDGGSPISSNSDSPKNQKHAADHDDCNRFVAEDFSREHLAYIVSQLLKAVDYLHANKVIHRDIKPDNIFLIRNEVAAANGFYDVRLGDFGFSRTLPESTSSASSSASSSSASPSPSLASSHSAKPQLLLSHTHTHAHPHAHTNTNTQSSCFMSGNIGTHMYCAPEVSETSLRRNKACYNLGADVFSLGVVLLETFCPVVTNSELMHIFQELQRQQLERNGSVEPLLDANSREWRHQIEIVRNMIAIEPKNRPPISQVIRDWQKLQSREDSETSHNPNDNSAEEHIPSKSELANWSKEQLINYILSFHAKLQEK